LHRLNTDVNLQIANNIFNSFLFEYYFAHQFSTISLNEPIEKFNLRYKVFRTIFPNSLYLDGIEELLPRLKRIYSEFNFQDISSDKGDLDSESMLIENYNNIKSLNDILDRFHGYVVYIDFWASWCPPCHSEFDYSKTLEEFANKNDIVLLYISTDGEDTNWIKVINKYNLRGYHARMVTEKFKNEHFLYKIDGIPRYMIVDKNGDIVIDDALRPSSQEELYNQLSKFTE